MLDALNKLCQLKTRKSLLVEVKRVHIFPRRFISHESGCLSEDGIGTGTQVFGGGFHSFSIFFIEEVSRQFLDWKLGERPLTNVLPFRKGF